MQEDPSNHMVQMVGTLGHYICHHVAVNYTRAEQARKTVDFFPHYKKKSFVSSDYHVYPAATY